MATLLTAHPLRAGTADEHRGWCDELRTRRDEFGASRCAVGIDRFTTWLQPAIDLVVARIEGTDPEGALQRLDRSDDPFDRWYRDVEFALHGTSLAEVAARPAQPVADHDHAPVDPFDPYMAMALVLLPGRAEGYRAMMRTGVDSGRGPGRARDWGINRLTVHLQQLADREVVLYEISGDLSRMVRELAADDTPDMREERMFFLEFFGIDLSAGEIPLPEPAFAWSSPPPGHT